MTEHIKVYGIKPRIQYIANGTLTTYSFPFVIFKESDLHVYLDETKQESDTYTLTGIRDSNGGTITFQTAPATGTIITLTRDLSIERTSDFQEGGALRADTLNDELDYQIACQQQIADNLNRSMVLPPYAINTDVNLTLPVPAPGKTIVWNSDGTNLENSTVAVNALESTLRGYKDTAESAAATATSKAEIASDKADIATEKAAETIATLESKANKDMDNLSTTGKATCAGLAMPSNNYVELTLGASDATYEAPANGWFALNKNHGNNSNQEILSMQNLCGGSEQWGDGILIRAPISHPGISNGIFIPAKKGDIIKVNYSYSGTTRAFRFYYAEGEI